MKITPYLLGHPPSCLPRRQHAQISAVLHKSSVSNSSTIHRTNASQSASTRDGPLVFTDFVHLAKDVLAPPMFLSPKVRPPPFHMRQFFFFFFSFLGGNTLRTTAHCSTCFKLRTARALSHTDELLSMHGQCALQSRSTASQCSHENGWSALASSFL